MSGVLKVKNKQPSKRQQCQHPTITRRRCQRRAQGGGLSAAELDDQLAFMPGKEDENEGHTSSRDGRKSTGGEKRCGGGGKNREIECAMTKIAPVYVHSVYIMLSFSVSVHLYTFSKTNLQLFLRQGRCKKGWVLVG